MSAMPSPKLETSFSAPAQQGLSAGDLVDPSSLPAWMSQQDNKADGADAPGAPNSTQPAQQGLSAASLLDPSSLPAWMSQQDNKADGAGAPGAPNSTQPGQTGLAAASLLDPNSLPPWLRKEQNQQNQQQSSPMSPVAGNPPWPQTTGQHSWPPAPSPIQTPPASSPASGIAASSFIDVNALPNWMRTEGGAGQQQSGSAGANRPGFAGPPRVENVRVPARPRNEFAAGDTNEVAANVFASMLGVASSSPQISGQPVGPSFPPQTGQSASPQGGQYNNNLPPLPHGSQPPTTGAPGMNPGMYGQNPAAPLGVAQPPSAAPSPYGMPGGYPGGMHQGNTPNPYATQSAAQNTNPFANRPGANPYNSAPYPGNMPGAGSPLSGVAGEAQKPAKPAKRGFFDALRDLFFH
jgi:hypothetical protein